MKRFEDTYPDHPKGAVLFLASVFSQHPDGQASAYLEASRATAALINAGVEVFSPIAYFYPLCTLNKVHHSKTDNEYWFQRNLPYMRRAAGLIVLRQPGCLWEESDGIIREREWFADRNSPEYSLEFPVCLKTP